MKYEKYCEGDDEFVARDECSRRSLGCEYVCRIKGMEVSENVRRKEERIFDEGVGEMVKSLIGDGWKISESNEFYGYFWKYGHILAPDYQGGFYCRK